MLSKTTLGQADCYPGQRWVKLRAFRDSAESSWPLSGTALNQIIFLSVHYTLLKCWNSLINCLTSIQAREDVEADRGLFGMKVFLPACQKTASDWFCLCIYRPRRMWRLNEVCQKTASDWFCLCIYMPRRMWRLSEVCQKTASDWLCLCRPLRMWRLSEVCLVWRSSCLPARRQPKWLLEGRPTTRSPTPTTASWVFIYIIKKQQQKYQIYKSFKGTFQPIFLSPVFYLSTLPGPLFRFRRVIRVLSLMNWLPWVGIRPWRDWLAGRNLFGGFLFYILLWISDQLSDIF